MVFGLLSETSAAAAAAMQHLQAQHPAVGEHGLEAQVSSFGSRGRGKVLFLSCEVGARFVPRRNIPRESNTVGVLQGLDMHVRGLPKWMQFKAKSADALTKAQQAKIVIPATATRTLLFLLADGHSKDQGVPWMTSEGKYFLENGL